MMGKGYNKPGDVQFLQSYDQNEAEVYPHPSIRVVRPGAHTWKYALTQYILTKRALYIGICLCVIAILLIIIVAVSVGARSSGSAKPLSDFGLLFYPQPVDGSNTIEYRPGDKKNYGLLLKNLTRFLKPYQPESQTSNDYIDCTSANGPATNESCSLDVSKIIPDYSELHDSDYGFTESLPYVWLQLRLPVDVVPNAVLNISKYYTEVKTAVGDRYDSDYISVSCKGKTPLDDEHLSRGTDEDIKYYPPKGFPLYYFPATHCQHYLAPIVAVKFNRIHSNFYVDVECTAWAVTPDGELSSQSERYTTAFRLKVY